MELLRLGDDGFINVVVLVLMFLITMSLHVEKISGILDLLLHTGVTGMSRGLCRGRGLFQGQDQGAGQGSLKLPLSLVLDHSVSSVLSYGSCFICF
jgi:hypothetical protein